ncbi:MAG: HAMP domain-containing sensor histidine kinase [Terriglobales bacterium]
MRLRTKILLSILLTALGLTSASLLVVRESVGKQVRAEILDDLNNSVVTFRNVQRQREGNLSRSAALLADLPTVKALMTSKDELTIQDASSDLWRLSGSSLFVLSDRNGKVMAVHTATPGFTHDLAQQALSHSLQPAGQNPDHKEDAQTTGWGPGHWWFGEGHLYEVFLQPIFFGPPAHGTLLGVLAVGYEIDEQVARDIGQVAASQVAFGYGHTLVVSTLSSPQQSALLADWEATGFRSLGGTPSDVELGDEQYLRTSMKLFADESGDVTLTVLKSYDQAAAFLQRLNRLLIVLGLLTIVAGGIIVVLISHTFTRPLQDLVEGVRSLEQGDFTYPLTQRADDEVAQVTAAFVRMRESLQLTQRQLLESEQLATIGRMASSISHDLRHSLTAVVANAEFLSEGRLGLQQREELYGEIRTAVDQMTDLLESLLEFSRTRESLHIALTSMEDLIRRSAAAVRAHPDFHRVAINVTCEGDTTGWFDPGKIERVFHNLLLNACEALPIGAGSIQVITRAENGSFVIRVKDNGHGIDDSIRSRLFHPFVSHGKENGTGLGLAVVQKIVQDHGGEISLESSSAAGTTFKIVLPNGHSPDHSANAEAPGPGLARNVRIH